MFLYKGNKNDATMGRELQLKKIFFWNLAATKFREVVIGPIVV